MEKRITKKEPKKTKKKAIPEKKNSKTEEKIQQIEDIGINQEENLKTIEKHVKTCKTIVEDLLNFARTSNPKKEKVCLHEIIDEALEFIREKSRKLGLSTLSSSKWAKRVNAALFKR